MIELPMNVLNLHKFKQILEFNDSREPMIKGKDMKVENPLRPLDNNH